MSAVVLKINVKVGNGGTFVLKVGEWILIPYNIDILEQQVVSQGISQMHTVDLGHHHSREGFVSIETCSRRRHLFKILCESENLKCEMQRVAAKYNYSILVFGTYDMVIKRVQAQLGSEGLGFEVGAKD